MLRGAIAAHGKHLLHSARQHHEPPKDFRDIRAHLCAIKLRRQDQPCRDRMRWRLAGRACIEMMRMWSSSFAHTYSGVADLCCRSADRRCGLAQDETSPTGSNARSRHAPRQTRTPGARKNNVASQKPERPAQSAPPDCGKGYAAHSSGTTPVRRSMAGGSARQFLALLCQIPRASGQSRCIPPADHHPIPRAQRGPRTHK